MEKTVEHAL